MPAVSEKQRRYLNWKMGHKWVKAHHFDNPGKLPERADRRERLVRQHLAGEKRRQARKGRS
jgi:hypothetical protein